MKFEPVAPDDMPRHRQGRRGRVSYPILKMFLETGLPVARFDRTGVQQSMQSLTSCLNAYVSSHKLPVKIYQRSGELYLARTDITTDSEGNPVGHVETNIDKLDRKGLPQEDDYNIVPENATPINAVEVEKRFKEEIGQVTK